MIIKERLTKLKVPKIKIEPKEKKSRWTTYKGIVHNIIAANQEKAVPAGFAEVKQAAAPVDWYDIGDIPAPKR